jgi:hypothetical protein
MRSRKKAGSRRLKSPSAESLQLMISLTALVIELIHTIS